MREVAAAKAEQIEAELKAAGWRVDGAMEFDCGNQIGVAIQVTDEPRRWAKRLPTDQASSEAFERVFRDKIASMPGRSGPR